MTFQRFADAGLATVEREVSLEREYGEPSRAWLWWPLGLAVAGLFVIVGLRKITPRTKSEKAKQFQLPKSITPFTVLGLLRDIEQNNGLDSRKQQDLAASIHRIEHYYFDVANGHEEPNIREIAETWVRQSI